MSEYDMNYALTELKEQKKWLRNYNAKMLQMVSKRIASSKRTLRELRKKGYKIGNLKYQFNNTSFCYNQSGFKIAKKNNVEYLYLSKIGIMEIRLHRDIEIKDIKQVIIKKFVDRWYAVITCRFEKVFNFIKPKKAGGIDVGITNFCYDSDNHKVENPLFLKKDLKKVRKANRKLSRRKKGSNNYQKAKRWYQIVHERIRNKRKDLLHKVSTYYSNRYDIIFLERLKIVNMTKNQKLSRAILDRSWYTFKQFLLYKCKKVIEVEPNYTSIDCSGCGNKVPKTLAIRTHRCDRCYLEIDRDYNASLNIKKKGLEYLPVQCREVTPVEIPKGSLKQEEATVLVQW